MTAPDRSDRPSSDRPSAGGAFAPRRSILTGAAWSVPAVMTASSAPAVTASPSPVLSVRSGVWAQVVDTRPGDEFETIYGVSSTHGDVAESNGTSTAGSDAAASSAQGDSRVTSGAGVFTPGGTSRGATGLYGGLGWWVSSPVDASGAFVPGTTTLASGAVFRMTLTAEFPEGEDPYEPLEWTDGLESVVVAQHRDSDGSPLREGWNAVGLRAEFGAAVIEGRRWTGSVTFTTTEDLVVRGPESPYAQILLSHVPLYYEAHGPRSITAAAAAVSGVLTLSSERADHPQTESLTPTTVEATLSAPTAP